MGSDGTMPEPVSSAPKALNSAQSASAEAMAKHEPLELLSLMKAGKVPAAPMSELIQFSLLEAERGRVVFVCDPAAKFLNSLGVIHGGFSMILLDTCMGVAVYSTLRAGVGYTSIETKVNFVKPVLPETGRLRAIGHAIHTGQRTGTAEGRLVDEAGTLYAHGTTTCFIYPL